MYLQMKPSPSTALRFVPSPNQSRNSLLAGTINSAFTASIIY